MPGSEIEEHGNDSDSLTKRYPRFGKRGAPQAFATKLLELLNRESPDVVGWTQSGAAFRIKDTDRFTSEVLSKYFKHNNASSFQRQLNLYGFRKVLKGPDTGSYLHPDFQRDKPEAMMSVRRTVQASQAAKRIHKNENLSSDALPDYVPVSRAHNGSGVRQDPKRRRLAKNDIGMSYGPIEGGLAGPGQPPMTMEGFPQMGYSQIPIGPHHMGYPIMNMSQNGNTMPNAGAGMINGMHLPAIGPLLLPAGSHPGMGGVPMPFYYPPPGGNADETNMTQAQIQASQHMMMPQYSQYYYGQPIGQQPLHSYNTSENQNANIMPRTNDTTESNALSSEFQAAQLQHVQNQAQFQMHLMGYGQSYNAAGGDYGQDLGGDQQGGVQNFAEQQIQQMQAFQHMMHQQQQANMGNMSYQQQVSRMTESVEQSTMQAADRAAAEFLANAAHKQSSDSSIAASEFGVSESKQVSQQNDASVGQQDLNVNQQQSVQSIQSHGHHIPPRQLQDQVGVSFAQQQHILAIKNQQVKNGYFQLQAMQRMQAMCQQQERDQTQINVAQQEEEQQHIAHQMHQTLHRLEQQAQNGCQNSDINSFSTSHDQQSWPLSPRAGQKSSMSVEDTASNAVVAAAAAAAVAIAAAAPPIINSPKANILGQDTRPLAMFVGGEEGPDDSGKGTQNAAIQHSVKFERSRMEV